MERWIMRSLNFSSSRRLRKLRVRILIGGGKLSLGSFVQRDNVMLVILNSSHTSGSGISSSGDISSGGISSGGISSGTDEIVATVFSNCFFVPRMHPLRWFASVANQHARSGDA